MNRIILSVLGLFCIVTTSLLTSCSKDGDGLMIQRTLIVAHRGFSGEYPENTIAAFKAAVEEKADFIELDVHLSKDGEIVVLHDDTIDRTTNGSGFVNDYTVAQLKEFDAGSWLDSKFAGEKIPTLVEAFNVVRDTHTRLCVEIKEKQGQYYPGLEERLVEIMHQNNLIGQCVVTSYSKDVVKNLKKLQPRLAIAYDPNKAEYKTFVDNPAKCAILVLNVRADMACFDHRNLTEGIIAECLNNGVPIWAWTVNEKDVMEKLVGWRVEAIMTNYPNILREVVGKSLAK